MAEAAVLAEAQHFFDIVLLPEGHSLEHLGKKNAEAHVKAHKARLFPEILPYQRAKLMHRERALARADILKLRQLLINVIGNAVKYTQDGGEILVSLKSDKDFAYIKVKDNGMGIPKEDIPHLFERFYRVDKARSRAKGGTGLGLAIAKEIIDAHGGKINIESEEGEGTEVTVALPL